MMMSSSAQDTAEVETLTASIKAKGDEIRSLKEGGADKESLGPTIAELVALKADFERVTGSPFDTPKKTKAKKTAPADDKKGGNASKADQQASRRITPRAENFSQWYLDIIAASEMTENSPTKGCMVIRPWGMAIWDAFKDDMDKRIKTYDVDNAYFPLLIPQSFLTKEAEHVDGFAKECAVVTHHRLCKSDDGTLIPDPEAKLEEPLVVRPTSETVIWTMYRKWIDSYRDLPLKLNQWANVVRWEMRTRPLLRSAEFLWQEGHTAHATKEEALSCAQEMLVEYSTACRETLALPTVMGVKSPKERFAGADETYTIEALMQNGWALQSGTSHFLGQNFARAFEVYYQTPDEKRELVWATSWGVTTRLMGAMVMTHSDDFGLRLPPAVAPKQVVIVPITKGPGEDTDLVNKAVDGVVDQLKAAGVRVKVDERPNMRPGAKYFQWEAKGVPLPVELGPKNPKAGVAIVLKKKGGGGRQSFHSDRREFRVLHRATA
ncbi:Proline--tRNA ligase, central part [Ectocarpus siliculosus]|uniref:Prolyl-tRNA synthetase n=1 Tax=Ectocarpus siliculosus TaxID=2880 RepID=D7FUP3_ECTSI|nr:Proline--tRNA ligase, central part [Ectocarpus siliculosus]|eukprot:CBJ31687.1 Proline--tRNA ligase, central part [Ectocarpus siliculosus]